MAESSAPAAGARKAGPSSSAARTRGGTAPRRKEQRDLRALQNMSADLSRLAHGGLDEEPASSMESEEGVTSASGASEGEARRAGGTSGTDAVPASSGDESFKQAGLKVRGCARSRLARSSAACAISQPATCIDAEPVCDLRPSTSWAPRSPAAYQACWAQAPGRYGPGRGSHCVARVWRVAGLMLAYRHWA